MRNKMGKMRTMKIDSMQQLQDIMTTTPGMVLYFTTPGCNVCQSLKPGIKKMLQEEFPKMVWCEIDCDKHPEISAQMGIFTVPTIVLYIDGKEVARLVRHFGIQNLREKLNRPYHLLFCE